MSLALAPTAPAPVAVVPDAKGHAPTDASLREAIRQACERIAPLWPLSSFVAVNPFLGFSTLDFGEAAAAHRRLTGAKMLMPRSFYRAAFDEGRITRTDIAAALARSGTGSLSADEVVRALGQDRAESTRPSDRIATVAEVLDGLSAGDRQVSRTAFMVDEISKWCAAYFDAGQAAWAAPWRGEPLYAAWRWAMRFDQNPQVMGVTGFSETVAAMPDDATEAIAFVLDALAIPSQKWADYLYRALFDVRGWAAYVRRLDWEADQAGGEGAWLVDLLAIRVVWGFALFRQRCDGAFVSAWRAALAASLGPAPQGASDSADLAVDLVLQDAYEHAYQRGLAARLAAPAAVAAPIRPALQAVFCIDVRSEPFRRALETVWPAARTLGFAGFFGMPMAYGEDEVEAHCPVLLRPSFSARPGGRPAAPRAGRALWSRFRQSAVSCFGYVEAFGLGYAVKLATAASGLGRTKTGGETPAPCAHGLDHDRRIDLAEGALRGMSLTDGFAPLVLLVGHGASTTNNPHAAGLDCGACGGHSGAPNARFAAALLNDPQVRAGLELRGISVPQDTWFLAALHDTTTDRLSLLDADVVPSRHRAALAQLSDRLEVASRLVRAERAPLLGLAQGDEHRIAARSRDWSQVRPEWGLARAAAFIAAPRSLTAGRDLEGRAFLHSYDRRSDPDLTVLELILTAPMIVASWISLQYYGSTVDNAAFGAGDKTLHNVCGRLGVLEGNAGDLRTGLPLQSVHDGERFVHEPVRLSVFIAADRGDIGTVLARHPPVKALLDNRWIHLFALDDRGCATHRYAGADNWETL
ncbi:MAG TPA: DUF2309 domain-containing protein [Caulobacteraceae bacterium]|nr:DUF2309 domain-containing protein [Caulobacteraceae bacterium]